MAHGPCYARHLALNMAVGGVSPLNYQSLMLNAHNLPKVVAIRPGVDELRGGGEELGHVNVVR